MLAKHHNEQCTCPKCQFIEPHIECYQFQMSLNESDYVLDSIYLDIDVWVVIYNTDNRQSSMTLNSWNYYCRVNKQFI